MAGKYTKRQRICKFLEKTLDIDFIFVYNSGSNSMRADIAQLARAADL